MDFSLIAKGFEHVKPVEPLIGGGAGAAGAAGAAGGVSFQQVFSGLIHGVKAAEANADQQMTAWMNGEQKDLHEVALSVQKAGLTFDVAMEVRNKMMSAYQEVMRMQL